MNINRNNYESFFLLLADDELSESEKNLVLHFASQHPDLEQELRTLQDCKLVPHFNPIFPKEKLLKPTIWNVDEPSSTQIQLLDLLHNELPTQAKIALEKKLKEDVALHAEWQTLKQSTLLPETIAHPNKAELYRQKEIKKIGWLQWAAAAAGVFGVGLFVLINNQPKAIDQGKFALQQNNKFEKMHKHFGTDDTAPGNRVNKQSLATISNSTTQSNTNISQDAINTPNNSTAKNQASTTTKRQPKQPINKVAAKVDDAPTYVTTMADVADANDRQPLNIHRDITTFETQPKGEIKLPTQLTAYTKAASAQSNLFNNANLATEDETPEKSYITIAGAKVNSQKVRGLLRGITRSLGRPFTSSKVQAAESLKPQSLQP